MLSAIVSVIGQIIIAIWSLLYKARPSITVAHGVAEGSGEISLEIYNKGANAQFAAQVRLLDGGEYFRHVRGPYWAYWEQSRGANATILRGHRDRIRLGAFAFWPRLHDGLVKSGLIDMTR